MEFEKHGLLLKARSIMSAIYGTVLWVTRLSTSSIQAPKALFADQNLQLGLGSLICKTTQNLNPSTHNIIHCHMLSSPPPPISSPLSSTASPPSTSYSFGGSSSSMGDLLGMENGVCMTTSEDFAFREQGKQYTHKQRGRRQLEERKRDYPPPITSLARTGNLSCRMPWVLHRDYVDGKLILREEKVKHYEYFEAIRENGHLRLNLIPLDHTVQCCHTAYEEDENETTKEDVEVKVENNDEDEDEMEESAQNNVMGNYYYDGIDDGNERQHHNIVVDYNMPEPCERNWMEEKGDVCKYFSDAAGGTLNPSFFHMPSPLNSSIDAILHSGSASRPSALFFEVWCTYSASSVAGSVS